MITVSDTNIPKCLTQFAVLLSSLLQSEEGYHVLSYYDFNYFKELTSGFGPFGWHLVLLFQKMQHSTPWGIWKTEYLPNWLMVA